MGLEPFVDTEIRSSIMGVPVFINQEIIAYLIRRASEGNFKDGLDNNKKSPWKHSGEHEADQTRSYHKAGL